jgi:ATP-dependent protease ClpP protease subunit
MAYIKADLDHWFDYSYLPSKRMIYVGSHNTETANDEGESGTDCQMSEFFIKAMLHLNSISSKPIFVNMNNIGGDYYHGMAMYDIIRLSPSHIYGTAWGYATSMGSIILQAFDTRIITPNSVVMIHDGEDSITGTPKSVEAWGKQSKKIRERTYEIYFARMKATKPRITLKKIEEMCSHDTIFTAKEAVDNGLADWQMISTQDPYKFYATEKQNAKWQPKMKSGKHEVEEEENE